MADEPQSRTYRDMCGIARGLDVVGERWALLVVRELMLGPKRFTDLRDGLPGASANILSQRLRELEAEGILARRTLPPPAGSKVYELTDRGRELEPVLLALGRWGSRCAPRDPGAGTSPDARILALRTLFDPALAGDLDVRVEITLGGTPYDCTISRGAFEAVRGPADAADARVTLPAERLPEVLWGGRPLADAVAGGDADVTGDAALAQRVLTLFPLGAPATVTSA